MTGNPPQDEDFEDSKIYHYCSTKYDKKANALYLMCAFQIIILQRTAEDAWALFDGYKKAITPYRDASVGECAYQCTVLP